MDEPVKLCPSCGNGDGLYLVMGNIQGQKDVHITLDGTVVEDVPGNKIKIDDSRAIVIGIACYHCDFLYVADDWATKPVDPRKALLDFRKDLD